MTVSLLESPIYLRNISPSKNRINPPFPLRKRRGKLGRAHLGSIRAVFLLMKVCFCRQNDAVRISILFMLRLQWLRCIENSGLSESLHKKEMFILNRDTRNEYACLGRIIKFFL